MGLKKIWNEISALWMFMAKFISLLFHHTQHLYSSSRQSHQKNTGSRAHISNTLKRLPNDSSSDAFSVITWPWRPQTVWMKSMSILVWSKIKTILLEKVLIRTSTPISEIPSMLMLRQMQPLFSRKRRKLRMNMWDPEPKPNSTVDMLGCVADSKICDSYKSHASPKQGVIIT